MFKLQSLVHIARGVVSAGPEHRSCDLLVADSPASLLSAVELFVNAHGTGKEPKYCEVRKITYPNGLLWSKEELEHNMHSSLFSADFCRS